MASPVSYIVLTLMYWISAHALWLGLFIAPIVASFMGIDSLISVYSRDWILQSSWRHQLLPEYGTTHNELAESIINIEQTLG